MIFAFLDPRNTALALCQASYHNIAAYRGLSCGNGMKINPLNLMTGIEK